MASLLREHGHFAVAGSYDTYDNAKDERRYVTDSAHHFALTKELFDKIIFMQEGGEHFIGRDTYASFDDPELREKCFELADKLDLLTISQPSSQCNHRDDTQ